jgi:hypothetical protein
MRILILVLSLIAISQIYSQNACSCPNSAFTLQQHYNNATYIFTGRVQNITTTNTHHDILFRVNTMWKGRQGTSIRVRTPLTAAACGFSFTKNLDYIVFAYSSNNALYTTLCTRTRLLDTACEDLLFLNRRRVANLTPARNV